MVVLLYVSADTLVRYYYLGLSSTITIISLRSGDTHGERGHQQQGNDNYSFRRPNVFSFYQIVVASSVSRSDWTCRRCCPIIDCQQVRQKPTSFFSFLPLTFRRLHLTGYAALVSSSAYFARMLRHRGAPKTRSRSFYFWRETSV